jgi:TonB-linked SusC/RagA family outer membrane protein
VFPPGGDEEHFFSFNTEIIKQNESMKKRMDNFRAIRVVHILMVKIFFLSAVCDAAQAYGHDNQSPLDKRVTCNFDNMPLRKILTELEKLAAVNFGYSASEVNVDERLSLKASERKLGDVLNEMLTPRSIVYEVKDKANFIILKPVRVLKASSVVDTAASSLRPHEYHASVAVVAPVSGKVISPDGQPLAGVSVLIKGTLTGTTTDAQGIYAVDADPGDILVFTFIGFHKYETIVGGRNVIDVTLQEDPATLEEVVVNAGYYTTSERMRTGNISRVTAEDISRQPVSNTLQAIQGRMPGVEIVQQSGVPGAGMKVTVRGRNSIRTEGNYPLYIIDGVPFISTPISSNGVLFGIGGTDPLNTINPVDIESIEVLKDADATAIYGSRGANGVILITTKKGKKGKTGLELDVYSGAGQASNRVDMMNTQQYIAMRKQAFANDSATPVAGQDPDLLQWDTTRYTDWQKKLIGGTAHMTDAQASFSGGSEKTSFRFGGGFHKESTVFPGDFGYQKGSGHFALNHVSANDKLSVNVSVTYGVDKNKLFNGSIMSAAMKLAPNAPALYNEDGTLNWPSASYNNVAAQFKNKQDIASHNLVSNATLSYEIVRGLRAKASLGYTDLRQDETIIFPRSARNPALQSFVQSLTQSLTNSVGTWIVEPQLVYGASFGDSRLDVQVGTTWQSSTTAARGFQGRGYVSEELLGNLNAATTISSLRDNRSEYRYNAVFGRVAYNWKEKYLVNFTGRRDGSSRFGADRKFANFGAVGAAWIFSEEDFLRHSLAFLSYGKMRASYGSTGSDQIGDYGYLDIYSPLTEPGGFRGSGGLYPMQLANPNYSWEINRKMEVAMDLGFIRDRILLSVSFYRNQSSNQLVGYRLPAITGFGTVQSNLPATVRNTGIELDLKTHNIQSNNFTWISALNLTIPRNKLVSYPNIEASPYANAYVVGQSIMALRMYQYQSVDPQTGVYKLNDVNGDGAYDARDLAVTGNLTRRLYGGFSNTLKYRNWTFDFLFEYVKQQGYSYMNLFGMPGSNSGNQPTDVQRRWQREGDATDVQKFSQSYVNALPFSWASSSNRNVVDADYLRLKTISLAYQLPVSWMERAKISGCTLYVRAQNLFTATSYVGLDPQIPGALNLPPLRMITGGLQLKI